LRTHQSRNGTDNMTSSDRRKQMLKRYVLTGAPGTGKTALAHALRQRGYSVVDEAATDVITSQQAQGVDQPWQRPDFPEAITRLQRQRQNAPVSSTVAMQIYDRSPLCTLALARYFHRPVPSLLTEEVARMINEQLYQRRVLLVHPLGFLTPTAAPTKTRWSCTGSTRPFTGNTATNSLTYRPPA
jgi:predicted ATPase